MKLGVFGSERAFGLSGEESPFGQANCSVLPRDRDEVFELMDLMLQQCANATVIRVGIPKATPGSKPNCKKL